MKFFFDNCLSPNLAKALSALFPHQTLIALRDKFAEDTKDSAWIRELGEEGDWVVVTDDRLWKVRDQRQELTKARLVVFATPKAWAQLKLNEQAARLIQLWPKLVESASRAQRGSWFQIPSRGFKFKSLN